MIRVDRFLSNLGFGSRREIAGRCKAGLVAKDNPGSVGTFQIINHADTKIPWGTILQLSMRDAIQVVEVKEFFTLLLHKPIGYVCSDVEDGGHPSYRELLNDCLYSQTLHVAGRLDWDTTGLVIATNDGNLNHQIISPKHKLIKTYIVTCEQEVTDDMLLQLQEGVTLLDDGYKTLPAKAKRRKAEKANINDKAIIELQITEGKYHQVKRMMEAVGNKVIALHRSAIGPRDLQGLKEGEWREVKS